MKIHCELGSFDLTDQNQIKLLAEGLSNIWTDALVPIAATMDEEHRGIFWGLVLAGPYGAMRRSIGPENSVAVHELLLKVALSVEADRRKALN